MPHVGIGALVAAVAVLLMSCGDGAGGAGGGPYAATTAINAYGRADHEQFRPGRLNKDAVAQAKAFSGYPLVWLGEKFEGFALTDLLSRPGSTYLIYGECESSSSREPSCVPPVEIIIHAPGTVPDLATLEPGVAVPAEFEREVQWHTMSGSLAFWTGTIVVTVDANSEHQEKAMQALRTVNHEALGIAEIGPGESLAALGR